MGSWKRLCTAESGEQCGKKTNRSKLGMALGKDRQQNLVWGIEYERVIEVGLYLGD